MRAKEFINETLKKVNGKWALVSKTDPSKVLQYYHGPGHPSEDWVKKVEARVHAFSEELEEAKTATEPSEYQKALHTYHTTKHDPEGFEYSLMRLPPGFRSDDDRINYGNEDDANRRMVKRWKEIIDAPIPSLSQRK